MIVDPAAVATLYRGECHGLFHHMLGLLEKAAGLVHVQLFVIAKQVREHGIDAEKLRLVLPPSLMPFMDGINENRFGLFFDSKKYIFVSI